MRFPKIRGFIGPCYCRCDRVRYPFCLDDCSVNGFSSAFRTVMKQDTFHSAAIGLCSAVGNSTASVESCSSTRLSDLSGRMYQHATVAVLLSRSWRVRKRAQQTVRKLLSSLGGSSLTHGLLGELRAVINKHKVQSKSLETSRLRSGKHPRSRLTVSCQVLPQDVLVSESGELTELGRSYIPPRVLLHALCMVSSSASQWGDSAESQNLAMELLIVAHHQSIGTRRRSPTVFI